MRGYEAITNQPANVLLRWPGGVVVGLEPERPGAGGQPKLAAKAKPKAQAEHDKPHSQGRRRQTSNLKGPMEKIIVTWPY